MADMRTEARFLYSLDEIVPASLWFNLDDAVNLGTFPVTGDIIAMEFRKVPADSKPGPDTDTGVDPNVLDLMVMGAVLARLAKGGK